MHNPCITIRFHVFLYETVRPKENTTLPLRVVTLGIFSLLSVACELPVVSSDVMLRISGPRQTLYTEGTEIMYKCRPKLQPQNNITSVCESDGRWSPDPALHNCTGQNMTLDIWLNSSNDKFSSSS